MSKFLRVTFYITIIVFILATSGLLFFKVEQLENKAQSTQQLLDELDSAYAELKAEALEAYYEGYDFYLNGILIDNKTVLIDSLLNYISIVSINHEGKYVELKKL